MGEASPPAAPRWSGATPAKVRKSIIRKSPVTVLFAQDRRSIASSAFQVGVAVELQQPDEDLADDTAADRSAGAAPRSPGRRPSSQDVEPERRESSRFSSPWVS